MMTMTGMLLEVKGLSVAYPAAAAPAAVRDVSFNLVAGSVLGVIGESGSGKTSLALALMGLLDTASARIAGEARFEGRELLGLSEKEMCRIRGSGMAMIFQDPVASLDPAMRVLDQVAETLRLHRGLDRKQARSLAGGELRKVGIEPELLEAAPYAHQLSGGQCQRAMIAAALACGPRLLIADEPTSSLDVTLQAQVVALLRERCRQDDIAMIFISHDLPLVSTVADEVMVMYRGGVVEHGACRQVLTNPSHQFTAEMIAAVADGQERGGATVAPA